MVLAQPRLASIMASEDVKFFDANCAAKMPLEAARPGLKLLFIEPKDSRKPTGCDAARPSAHTICCSLSFNNLPTAARLQDPRRHGLFHGAQRWRRVLDRVDAFSQSLPYRNFDNNISR